MLDDDENSLGEVYFQPPEGFAMTYPCIVYTEAYSKTQFADNFPYGYTPRYQLTVIDENPDSEIPIKVRQLPMTAFVRSFTTANLNHKIYNTYF